MADITAEQFKEAARKAAAAGDTATARSLIAKAQAAEASATGIIDQAGSGANEGLASFLGFPVDMATKAINAMEAPVDVNIPLDGSQGTMTERPPLIQDPVGGSGTFRDILSPLISDAQPQTTAQRYARRIGQEVGFGGPAALLGARLPGMMPAVENPAAYVAASTAGDVGAGIGGQTSREFFPDSDVADLAASVIGGVGGAGAVSMMMPKYGKAPTLDEVKAKASDKWKAVENADVKLTPQAEAEYLDALNSRMTKERATDTRLFPRANAAVEGIGDNADRSLYGIEQDRRFIGRSVAANKDEAAAGVALKQEIDDYLKSLDASKVQGADPEQAVQDAIDARALTHRVKKAESIINKEMRGESRAATSGTGGNEVNAKRQNIRALYDIERDPTLKGRRQGFTPDEVAQMGRVVEGTKAANVARMLGRLSPTSGALPMMATGIGGATGGTAALMGGSPLLGIPFLAGGVGIAAKEAAEGMTKREIKKLLDMVLSGGSLPKSTANPAAKRAIIQQLLSRAGEKVGEQ